MQSNETSEAKAHGAANAADGRCGIRVPSPYDALEPQRDPARRVDPKQRRALASICASYATVDAAPLENTALWRAEFFGLEGSSLFARLGPSRQEDILARMGRAILEEAQLIEVAGTTYTAKMALLADTLEGRSLYGFFAADEARHLQLFTALIGEPTRRAREANGFLAFLDGIIQNEAPDVLVMLVQVLLEGWGIRYYGALARECTQEPVADAFKSILLDEGKHHGSGLALFDETRLGARDTRRLEELVASFFEMVRMGPVALAGQTAQAAGGISRAEVRTLLEELAFDRKLSSDLKLLSSLLALSGAEALAARLEAKGLFAVPTLAQCHASVCGALGVSA